MTERLRDRVRAAVERRVAVDARAVAALRVALGVLLVVDYLSRARWLRAFYTDAGVFPRAALRETHPTLARLSVHALWGEAEPQALAFAVGVAAAVALAVGYRSRTAAVVSWLLLVSLHARNPVVLNGGDSLLRRTLLWSLFCPLGARWSLDAAAGRARRRTTDDRLAGPATAALLVQPVVVYATNGLLKLRGNAWPSGRGIHTVFALDRYTTPVGETVAAAPSLLAALGWGWLALLLVSPALVVLTGRRRTLLAAAFAACHLGMAVTMWLGVFPFVALAALLPFVDARVWDRVEAVVGRGSTPTTPVARHRLRAAGRVTVVGLLVCVGVWNGLALGVVDAPDGVPAAEHRWDMFAPTPPSARLWVVAHGVTTAGDRVAVSADGDGDAHPPPASTTRPTPAFDTVRWRKYLTAVAGTRDPALERALAAGLCRRWNRSHGTRLRRLSVVVVTEPVAGDERRRREVASGACPTAVSSRRPVPSSRRPRRTPRAAGPPPGR